MPHSRVTVATIALSLCCLITALAMGLDLSGFSVRAFGSASDLASRISFKPTIAEDGQPRDKQPLENSLGFSTVSKKSVQPDSLLYLHVPLLTYGLQKGLPGLPNGDLFKLVDELHYEGNAPDGIKAGHLNSGSFGDIPVPYAVNGAIVMNPTPGSVFHLHTHDDENFRLVHFTLASLNQVLGQVSFHLYGPGGLDIPLADFRVDNNVATLVSKNADIAIYENDLLGAGESKKAADQLKMNFNAGEAGVRTGLLTMKFSNSLRRCLSLRLEIANNGNGGQVSIAMIDHVVARVTQSGDASSPLKGLLQGTSGGFPTKFECSQYAVIEDQAGSGQDTTGPVFSNVPSDISQTISAGNSATVNFSVPTAIDAVDGVRPVTTTRSDGQSGNVFPVGQTTVTFTASDTKGNTSTASFKVTIINASQPPPQDANFEIHSFAGNGSYGAASSSGLATTAVFKEPRGVAVDAAGNVYISDAKSAVVRRVNGSAIFAFAGTGLKGSGGDGGLATAASFNNPTGLAVDSSGNLYIADTNNHRIRKVVGSTITTIAGNGLAGFAGDGGNATNAKLNYPTAVAVDAAGNVYIADTGNNRIRKITGTTISTIAGNGVPGFAGDGGVATNATLNAPAGVAVSADGNTFYIADTGNNRVRKVVATTISTLAGNGAAGFGGDSGIADQATLHAPVGLVLDANGNLLIADSDNERIRLVKLSDQTISTMAGNGTAGNSGDGFSSTGAMLNTPTAIAFHSATGKVYIADTGNLRIRQLMPIASNNAAPVIAAIPASTVNAGQTLNISLSATDADGDPVTFSLPQGAPAFLSISNANPQARTATLHVAPACANLGSYSLAVQASDGKSTTAPSSFNLTINDLLNACSVGPVINSITPSVSKRGQTISMTINGSNFDAGADVSFTGGGITLSNVKVNNTQITLTMKISPTATVSKRTVTVMNSNGQSYSLPQSFQVTP